MYDGIDVFTANIIILSCCFLGFFYSLYNYSLIKKIDINKLDEENKEYLLNQKKVEKIVEIG